MLSKRTVTGGGSILPWLYSWKKSNQKQSKWPGRVINFPGDFYAQFLDSLQRSASHILARCYCLFPLSLSGASDLWSRCITTYVMLNGWNTGSNTEIQSDLNVPYTCSFIHRLFIHAYSTRRQWKTRTRQLLQPITSSPAPPLQSHRLFHRQTVIHNRPKEIPEIPYSKHSTKSRAGLSCSRYDR